MLNSIKQEIKLLVGETSFSQLERYVNLIEEKNKVMNLTGFSGEKLWKEGILESILTLNFVQKWTKKKKNFSLVDIGSGVGFPSIPYLIFNPNIDLTIVESLQKRCDFLKLVAKELGLKFNLVCNRMENVDQKFDILTARAVTSLDKLIKLTKKNLTSSSIVAFIKGPKIFDEIKTVEKENFIIEKVNEIESKNVYVVFNKKPLI
ncbi:16S rRNA (guanine(527)-N(7))-methyltransferase RsmG [Mesomycoplasma conjunctivae]|uniref:16S rRNA (guanine(527)-N(7))-methyltransferase RsmG n=1 Tax=Mesomycoplasma conjunctivae TaxID=45361 RepID=UPI003DA1F544